VHGVQCLPYSTPYVQQYRLQRWYSHYTLYGYPATVLIVVAIMLAHLHRGLLSVVLQYRRGNRLLATVQYITIGCFWGTAPLLYRLFWEGLVGIIIPVPPLVGCTFYGGVSSMRVTPSR
jgi:hypothetical protein